MSMKELHKKGIEAQIKADIEAAELDAWTPPTATWREVWNHTEAWRNSKIAQINAFNTPNLVAIHAKRHGEDCICITQHLEA